MQQREEQMHLQQQADMRHVEEQDMHEQQFGNDEEDMGRGGALVEEAKRLMADDGDEMPAQNEAGGPKIKMGRLGKRGKKPAEGGAPAKGEEKSKSTAGGAAAALSKGAAMHPSGGFNEKDIEFMKKAIQVLCQSTNPLGRSIEFVTDDLDSMNKEFEHWRKES